MEFDHVNEINLHYKMLEYIFNTKGLNSSCFGYFWDTFRSENLEFFNLAATQLKKIFWEQIIPSIDNYQLLDSDSKTYFTRENLLNINDGSFEAILNNNEPKADGKDFVYAAAASEEDDNEIHHESVCDIFKNKTTYKGSFSFDTDSDQEDFCVRIKSTNPLTADETNDVSRSIMKPFNLLLHAEYELREDCQEIVSDLGDENAFSSVECLEKFPRGFKDYLSQIDFFRDFNEVMGKDADAETVDGSELDVPEEFSSNVSSQTGSLSVNDPRYFSSARESLSDLTNSTRRSLRSAASSSWKDVCGSSNSSKSGSIRKVRTKPTLVEEPAVNARMDTFVAGFKATKRRRITKSPESTLD